MPSNGTKQEPTPTALPTNIQKPRKSTSIIPLGNICGIRKPNQSRDRLNLPQLPFPAKHNALICAKPPPFHPKRNQYRFKFPLNRSTRIQRNHIIIASRPGSRPRTSQGKHDGEEKSASSLPAPKSASRGGRGSTGGGTPASGEPMRRRNRRESTAARGIRRFGSCVPAGGGGGRASET
ncbi:hypothetical protein PVAP13_7KG413370 [Panicum virgatum]|uniref:Uncharacterized protein n=1 Tax=Panicum virgatum TaxID=38727 RepID=A0A8T0QPR2_PANVG|nr:hypothetical protein PVAP13_7KG413370 [Panicum virgatum]